MHQRRAESPLALSPPTSIVIGVRGPIVFSYTHRQTDFTEKYFVRVDIHEEFPFLVTKLPSYYDR